MSQVVLVAGATGFVGRAVVPALVAAGHTVRCGSRDPARAAARDPRADWIRLDVADPASLDTALQGVDTLVYLVHQMRSHGTDLLAEERASARRVAQAAARAGLRRIVYLGGPQPRGEASPHLAARLATGHTLREGPVPTVELQAGMIIGVGSESWLIVRDLALRLPVMILPRWLSRRSQPLAIDDVVSAIVRSVEAEVGGSLCLALPGPEALSAEALLRRIAAAAGIRPIMVPVPVLTPSLSSHWIRWVTRADYTIARQLVDGLTCDLVATGDSFWTQHPDLPRTPLDQAIAATLQGEAPLPRWQQGWEQLVRRLSLAPRR